MNLASTARALFTLGLSTASRVSAQTTQNATHDSSFGWHEVLALGGMVAFIVIVCLGCNAANRPPVHEHEDDQKHRELESITNGEYQYQEEDSIDQEKNSIPLKSLSHKR